MKRGCSYAVNGVEFPFKIRQAIDVFDVGYILKIYCREIHNGGGFMIKTIIIALLFTGFAYGEEESNIFTSTDNSFIIEKPKGWFFENAVPLSNTLPLKKEYKEFLEKSKRNDQPVIIIQRYKKNTNRYNPFLRIDVTPLNGNVVIDLHRLIINHKTVMAKATYGYSDIGEIQKINIGGCGALSHKYKYIAVVEKDKTFEVLCTMTFFQKGSKIYRIHCCCAVEGSENTENEFNAITNTIRFYGASE